MSAAQAKDGCPVHGTDWNSNCVRCGVEERKFVERKMAEIAEAHGDVSA